MRSTNRILTAAINVGGTDRDLYCERIAAQGLGAYAAAIQSAYTPRTERLAIPVAANATLVVNLTRGGFVENAYIA